MVGKGTFIPSPGGQGEASREKCFWQREHSKYKGTEVGKGGILERVVRKEVTVATMLDQKGSSGSP